MIKTITRIRLTNGLIHIDCDSSVQFGHTCGPPIVRHIYVAPLTLSDPLLSLWRNYPHPGVSGSKEWTVWKMWSEFIWLKTAQPNNRAFKLKPKQWLYGILSVTQLRGGLSNVYSALLSHKFPLDFYCPYCHQGQFRAVCFNFYLLIIKLCHIIRRNLKRSSRKPSRWIKINFCCVRLHKCGSFV